MNKFELAQAWHSEIPAEQTSRLGHKSSGIFGLQLTPDDRYALTLNYQYRELIVWDFASGQRLFSRSWGGYNKVRGLYLTPDGAYAVVTGETGGVVPIIPEEPSRQLFLLRQLSLPSGNSYRLAPLIPGEPPHQPPQEDYVLVNARSQRAISNNGTYARVWDFRTGLFGTTLELPVIKRDENQWMDPLHISSISADGRLGAGMFDSHALVWDLENGKLLWQHDFRGRKPQYMVFTPDGKQIVLDDNSRIETWRWSTNKMDGITFDTHGGRVHSPVFTPNGQNLIIGTDDGAIQIWDWLDGRLEKTLSGHKHDIECLAVSADGEYLASTGRDTTLRKWHLPTGKQIFSTLTPYNDLRPLSIDPDGHYIVGPYGYDRTALAIYDLASGAIKWVLQGHWGNVNVVDYLTDGRLLSASDDHTLRIWNLESGESVLTLSGEHTGPVLATAAVPGRAQVISAGADGRIVLWDLPTGGPVRPPLTYVQPKSWTDQHVYVHPDGRRAIACRAGTDNKGRVTVLWDLESGREMLQWYLSGPGDNISGTMLSPSGRLLIQLEGMWEGIKITDLETQQCVRYNIGGRIGDLWCLTPDEQTLVSTYGLATVVLIDLKSGVYRFASMPSVVPPNRRITALALSPDGRLGAIAADNYIRIWELSSGDELAALNTDEIFFRLVFDPNNRYILAGGSNMRIYCMEMQELRKG